MMKRFLTLTAALLLVGLVGSVAIGDAVAGVPDPASVEETAAPAVDPSAEWIVDLATKYPVLSTILVLIGCLRILIKPIFAALHAYVKSTDSERDDEILRAIERSKALNAFVFVLDWVSSIKLKK